MNVYQPERIAVVIPARNEASSVGSVVEDVHCRYPGLDVIVVDDASEDETYAIAKRAGAHVIRLPVRLGYGGAVQTGLKFAYGKGYDAVILMDADGQHDPAYIKHLIEALQTHDLAIGSRFLGEACYGIPFLRLAGMKLFSKVVSILIGKRMTDTSSGFQAMRRNVVSLFALGHYPADFPDADMIIWVARHGYNVGEVGVRMYVRMVGRPMVSGFGSSLRYALKMPLAILVTLLRVPARRREGEK